MFFQNPDNLDALKSNEIPQNIIDQVRETYENASNVDRNWAYFHAFVFSIPEFSLKKRLIACKNFIQLKGNDYSIIKRIISIIKSTLFHENERDIMKNSHIFLCAEIIEALAQEKFPTESTAFIIQSLAEIARATTIGETEKKKITSSNINDKTKQFHDTCYCALEKILEDSQEESIQWDKYLIVLSQITPNIKNENKYISERATKFIFDLQDQIVRWEEGLFQLIPQLVVKACTAKVDIRNITTISVIEFFEAIEEPERIEKLVQFFELLLRNKESSRRLYAVECLSKLFESRVKKLDRNHDLQMKFFSRLFHSLLSRFPDRVSSIRTKATSGLLNILKNANHSEETKDALFQILISQKSNIENNLDDSMQDLNESFSENSPSNFIECVMSHKGYIGSRIYDLCSPVRKAAIQVISQLTIMYPTHFLTDRFIRMLKGFAVDDSLTNRKQSLKLFDQLVDIFPTHDELYKRLLTTMLLLITDVENSVVTLALDVASRRFMKSISKNDERFFSILQTFSVSQLNRIKLLFSVLKKEKILKSRDLVKIQDFIVDKNSNLVAAWILYDELSHYFPEEVDNLFVKETFETIDFTPEEDRQEHQSQILFHCTNILSKVSHLCDEEEKKQLIERIGEKVVNFEVPSSLIHGYIATLSTITSDSAQKRNQLFYQILNNEFYTMFNEAISGHILISEKKILRCLTTIGETAVCFHQCTVPQKFITLVQGLLSTSLERVRDSFSNRSTVNQSPMNSNGSSKTSSHVRALAFATMGKMCLTNESLFRKCEKIFIRELQQAQDPEVRNNILIVVCDLCVQYSGVDRFVSRIGERMKDSSLLVRRNAVSLLSQLLSEDYIKWDPIIFFRFASVIANSDEFVSRSACHVLTNILPRKQPHLLFNHFIETIFVLNKCKEHEVYNQFPQTQYEATQFSYPNVEGDERKTKINTSKRHIIYKFLLNQLTEEDKLKLHGRLHSELLPSFTESKIRNESVLLDVFSILSSQDMKLNKTTSSEEELDAAAHFSSQMVNEILKRHIRDNVLPVLVDLKKSLEKKRSPCLGNLLDYFHSISILYPSEVQDLLKHDRQLRGEFEYDARRRLAPRQTQVTEINPPSINRTNAPLPSLTSTSKKKKRNGHYEGPKTTPARVLQNEFMSLQSPRQILSPNLIRSPQIQSSSNLKSNLLRSVQKELDFEENIQLETPSPNVNKHSTPQSLRKVLFDAPNSENRRLSTSMMR